MVFLVHHDLGGGVGLLGAASGAPIITNPAGVLAALLAVLAIIFWLSQHERYGRIFKIIPALVFCYFVPTLLTTLGVTPDESALYSWVKKFVLPASLLLLILSLDLPAIIRLGPKAVIMLLAGTLGVVIGGPIALVLTTKILSMASVFFSEPTALPDDVWQGMSALAGSWIGGGANFVAIGEMAGASSGMIALMIIPDVFVASIWMGTLLYLSGHQRAIDRWTGANAEAIRDLERRLTNFQERVTRIPSLADLIIIVAFGFVGSWLSFWAANTLHDTFENALTVDAMHLSAEPDEASTSFAQLSKAAINKNEVEYRLTLSTERRASSLEATTATEDSAARAESVAIETHTIVVESDRFATLATLISHINAHVPGWSAEVLPGIPEEMSKSRQLRAFGRSRLAADGITLRLPDPSHSTLWNMHSSMGTSTWKYIFITAVGIGLSFTRVRNLEGAGASKIGSVMIYLLVACIGAGANFRTIFEHPAVLLMGFIWMGVHIVVLLSVARLIRAPLFFVAVGSQANIGGAASAPVVAAAFHPSLAPVGALLAVAGYVLGTYAGLVCMYLLRWAAGVG